MTYTVVMGILLISGNNSGLNSPFHENHREPTTFLQET